MYCIEATSKSIVLRNTFDPYDVTIKYYECFVDDLRGGHQVIKLIGTSSNLLCTTVKSLQFHIIKLLFDAKYVEFSTCCCKKFIIT